ncbi:MAG: hypothetical protein KUG77_18255, partial [Nannocystaceae bacterium]|nr:hypothetical protein [Nannocystaceae bacterium]
SLRLPLAEALGALERAVARPGGFIPATAQLKVAVALPDLLAPLLPSLVAALHRQAPGLEVRIVPIPADLPTALAGDDCWLAIAPTQFGSDTTIARGLGSLHFGVVARASHPALRRNLTLKRWLSHPHVVVSVGNSTRNVVGRALAEAGLERKIGLRVPSFLAGLVAVSTSDLLMNAPMPLGDDVTRLLGVATRKLPLAVPAVKLSILWHERMHHDPAHIWVRQQLYETVRAWLKPRGRRREAV